MAIFPWNQTKAIVTGGGGGIGRATVLTLLEKGARVSAWDLDPDALDQLKANTTHRDRLCVEQLDITDHGALVSALDRSAKAMGGMSLLINNAGFMARGNFDQRELEAWHKTVEVNFTAVLNLTHRALPLLKESAKIGHRPRIVNLSSAAAYIGTAGIAVYSGAKWALWGWSEGLRQELRPHGVGVTTVHPSYLKDGMFAGAELKGLGRILVPPVSSHQKIANGIVRAVVRSKNRVTIPGTVTSLLFLRSLLSDGAFQAFARAIGVHDSMEKWKGQGRSIQ